MNRATTAFVALGLIWGSNFLFMKWASETITAGQITLLWVLFGFLPVLVYAAIRGAFDRLDITASSPELLRRLHLRTADAVGELSEVLITDDQEIRAARQGGRTLTFRGASEDHRRTKEGMLPIEAVILRRQLAWSRGDGPAASQSHLGGGYRVFFGVMVAELDPASIGDDGQAVAGEVGPDLLGEHACAEILQFGPREAVGVERVTQHTDDKAGIVRNDWTPLEECPDARPQGVEGRRRGYVGWSIATHDMAPLGRASPDVGHYGTLAIDAHLTMFAAITRAAVDRGQGRERVAIPLPPAGPS